MSILRGICGAGATPLALRYGAELARYLCRAREGIGRVARFACSLKAWARISIVSVLTGMGGLGKTLLAAAGVERGCDTKQACENRDKTILREEVRMLIG